MAAGRATVKAVLSGDTVVLMGSAANGPPPELVLTLSSLQAPRLARSPEQTNEPFAWAAREFLRKLCIGKAVRFQVDYKVAAINRDFGSVWILQDDKEENVNATVAGSGFVKVKDPEASRDPSAPNVEELLAKESDAKESSLGQYADPAPKNAHTSVQWGVPSASALVNEHKGKQVSALVEGVANGATLRVILRPSMQLINLSIAGVQCPRLNPPAGEESQGPAPFAREAKHFTETRLLHRDVKVHLDGVDKFNNIFGSVLHPSGHDIGIELLKNGLARMVDWNSHATSPELRRNMRAAETEAKNQKLRVWRDYQAPVLSSDSELKGSVVEVVSGDCVVVYIPATNEEKRLYLSSIRAPRLGNVRRHESHAPYAVDSKETLRQRAIGQTVKIEVDYERPPPANAPNSQPMTFASLLMQPTKKENREHNLGIEMVGLGMAEVLRHKPEEPKSRYIDDLLSAETKAKSKKKGMHSGKQAPEHRYTDLCVDATKAKQYLPFLRREKQAKAVVEHVYSAARVKLFVPSENCSLNFVLAGVKAPQPTKFGAQGVVNQAAEPFGEEAKLFTRRSIMQRDVVVEFEDMDRGGNAFGPLYVDKNDFGSKLLSEGLAWVDSFSIERTKQSSALQQSEESAKSNRKNVWKNYDPEKEELERQVKEVGAASNLKKDEKVAKAHLSEIVQANVVYVQNVSDGTCALVEKKMKDFTATHGTSGKTIEVRRNSVVAALFDDGSGPMWNRGKVERVQSDGSVQVRFLDYGNTALISPHELRPLDADLVQFPPQAQGCVLAFIKDLPPNEEFGTEAAKLLGDMAWGKDLSVSKHGVDDQGRWRVTLHLQGKSIAESLVEEGLLRVDRKSVKKVPSHQQGVVDALLAAQESAKKKRKCMWELGDIESDEDL